MEGIGVASSASAASPPTQAQKIAEQAEQMSARQDEAVAELVKRQADFSSNRAEALARQAEKIENRAERQTQQSNLGRRLDISV